MRLSLKDIGRPAPISPDMPQSLALYQLSPLSGGSCGVLPMALRRLILAVASVAALAGCTATRDFHGYLADQAQPTDVQSGVDTRSTVLARLGTPSTTSIFDDNLWVYMSSTRELLTFYYPKVVQREIVAIQFDDDDV